MPLAMLDSSIFKMSFPQVFLSTWEKTVQLKLSYKGDAEVSSCKNMCIAETIYFKTPVSLFNGVNWK